MKQYLIMVFIILTTIRRYFAYHIIKPLWRLCLW